MSTPDIQTLMAEMPEHAGAMRRQVHLACDAAPIILHLVEFEPEHFSSAFFAQAGIACPESIQRSVGKRQAEFFFGRLAARTALSALGIKNETVPIGAERQPIWPNGVIGSMTHTHGLAAVAVEWAGRRRGIGIDVECVMNEQACEAVVMTVLDRSELHCLQATRELALPVALTIVFSAKESFYKAAYGSVRRFFDFSAVRVVELNVQARRLTFVLTETLSGDFHSSQLFHAGFDFIKDGVVLTHAVW
ncbi:4'-phosphopantetheinyl transferase family protein [Dyella flagellata]|nr:4'-phosphopantetheinyl transferase superfamily protein [Dyella flagellata]